MPSRRTGVDAVMLPNGKVILVNGASMGVIAGGYDGGGIAGAPVFEAW